jgi:hypothetical protein
MTFLNNMSGTMKLEIDVEEKHTSPFKDEKK